MIGLALLLSVAVASPAAASFPGDNGRIVSVEPRYDWENCPAEEGGHCDAPESLGPMIMTQTRDGENRKDLAIGNDPSWDAEGDKLVYVSTGYRISKINADGTGRRYLSAPYAEPGEAEMIDTRPAWSPTGRRVVFQRTWDTGEKRIMILHSDGSPAPRAVTRGARPEWSSRGKIAYLRRVDGVWHVYVIRPNGDDRRRVPNTAGATDVTWSPSGRRVAFVKPGTDGTECVRVVRTDGTRLRNLGCDYDGADGGNIQGISWAPSGGSLLVGIHDFFEEPLHSEGRILRVRLDGTRQQLGATGFMPDWRPRP